MEISLGRSRYQQFNVVDRVLTISIALNDSFVTVLNCVLEPAP
jgi:hypothetical protein